MERSQKSIMIRLKDIKMNGNIISATVTTVEAHPITFEIAVDIVEKKLIKNTSGEIDMNVGMAMAQLIRLTEEYGNKIPEKSESVWY